MSVINLNRKTIADIFSLFGVTHLNLPFTGDHDKAKIAQINKAFTVSDYTPTVYCAKTGQTCFSAKLKDLLPSEELERIFQDITPIYENGVLFQRNPRNSGVVPAFERDRFYKDYELIHPENWEVFLFIYFHCYSYETSEMSFQLYANYRQHASDYRRHDSAKGMGCINCNGPRNNINSSFFTKFDESHVINGVDKVKEKIAETFCNDLADNIIYSVLSEVREHMYDTVDDFRAANASGNGKETAYNWMVRNCPLRQNQTPDTNEDF